MYQCTLWSSKYDSLILCLYSRLSILCCQYGRLNTILDLGGGSKRVRKYLDRSRPV